MLSVYMYEVVLNVFLVEVEYYLCFFVFVKVWSARLYSF